MNLRSVTRLRILILVAVVLPSAGLLCQETAPSMPPAARLELLDPMDTAGSEAGDTYVERMRHDLNVIASAAGLPLDVNAPAPAGGAK